MPDAQLICPKAKEHETRPSRSQRLVAGNSGAVAPERKVLDMPTTKILLTVPEFCEATGIGLTKAKELIRRGEVQSIRIGLRSRRIPVVAVHDWVERLLQVSTTGMGMRCRVCGHRGDVSEFYVKNAGINVPTAGAVAGGGLPGGPG